MFRNTIPDTEPVPEVTPPADLISLVELSLSLPEPSEGWALFLGRRGISFQSDDLGRDSISRGAAKRLLDEQRADVLRVRALRAEQERQAVAADQAFRAALPKGLHWTELPHGVSPAEAWQAAELAAQPKRESVLQHALANSGEMTYHPISQGEE